MRFRDRTDAGRRLAELLQDLHLADPVVLALPRGGVPVGYEIAVSLGAPLEVFVARKVGAPWHPEFGIGAVAEGDGFVPNRDALTALELTQRDLEGLIAHERVELQRRVAHYRGGRPLPEVTGRDVVLVDDGLATGVTAEAALRALLAHRPRRLVLAAPVCAPETKARLAAIADDVVCVTAPEGFYAVGQWYENFGQTTDQEVLDILERAAATPAG